MYNQQFQNTGISQYQGLQKQFQPVGAVQSFYGQSQQQQYGIQPSPTSYHTANYRGNQPGHDQSKRGDSFTPSNQHMQSGFQAGGTARYGGSISQQFGVSGSFANARGNVSPSAFGQTSPIGQASFGQATPAFGQTAPSFGQSQWQNQGQGFAPSIESYHTANYQGNQPGHDQAKRGDSFAPTSQQGFGQSIETYHTANYQGNQPGHDQFKRGDSFQPTGQGLGMQSGFQSGFGMPSSQQAYGTQNNFGQQFGF
jgi:hypothetical protein